jgi:hypothetical protein
LRFYLLRDRMVDASTQDYNDAPQSAIIHRWRHLISFFIDLYFLLHNDYLFFSYVFRGARVPLAVDNDEF